MTFNFVVWQKFDTFVPTAIRVRDFQFPPQQREGSIIALLF